ncbi:MAG TPA: hypothetical protein VNZ03_19085 [Terriglobales bacterium]|jgi:hypothetical protein|nr:hypothetical protein [Terriglobales bacterium]
MHSTSYFSAWTDSGCLLGCFHEHPTVASAVACISYAGGYVIAVEKGVLRALNDAEDKEFRKAVYGSEVHQSTKPLTRDDVLTILFTIRVRLRVQS